PALSPHPFLLCTDTATTEIYTLSLHDALPISSKVALGDTVQFLDGTNINVTRNGNDLTIGTAANLTADSLTINNGGPVLGSTGIDRKSTRLNSSHVKISYAVFCLKKKKQTQSK